MSYVVTIKALGGWRGIAVFLLIDKSVNNIQRGAFVLSSCACNEAAPPPDSCLCWDSAWMETS